MLRLFLLTGAHDEFTRTGRVSSEPPSIDLLPSLTVQREEVEERVRQQTVRLLGSWDAERPSPLPLESPAAPPTDAQRAEAAAEHKVEVAAAQRRAFGFELHVAPSAAGPRAGNGIFLRGSAPPGAVIALYPGVTYDPADVLLLPGGTRHFDGNEYLMARFDKSIVDASKQALALLPPEARACPLAVAHNANHPPADAAPNVAPAPVSFDRSVPEALLPLLPNVSYQRSSHSQRTLLLESSLGDGTSDRENAPVRRRDLGDLFRASLAEAMRTGESDDEPVLKGLVFVATRRIEDEELFLNYRLNPRNGYPSWYKPYDPEEDARRWS